VHDIQVDVARRVVVELLAPAKVDDAGDPVLGERTPAVVGEPPDVVGADQPAEQRLAAVLEPDAAEVADVEAALPLEQPRQTAASAPRYASITAGFRRTSSGVPSAITRPKSSTWIRSAVLITSPM
jgi:hypothetical protein